MMEIKEAQNYRYLKMMEYKMKKQEENEALK